MQARCARAGALQHLGKLEEAEEEFTLALQIQPTLESFCYMTGGTCAHRHHLFVQHC